MSLTKLFQLESFILNRKVTNPERLTTSEPVLFYSNELLYRLLGERIADFCLENTSVLSVEQTQLLARIMLDVKTGHGNITFLFHPLYFLHFSSFLIRLSRHEPRVYTTENRSENKVRLYI
jgi:hypothetical protein